MDGLGLRRACLGRHASVRIRWAKDTQGPSNGIPLGLLHPSGNRLCGRLELTRQLFGRASRSHQIDHLSPELRRISGSVTGHQTPQKSTSRVSTKPGQLQLQLHSNGLPPAFLRVFFNPRARFTAGYASGPRRLTGAMPTGRWRRSGRSRFFAVLKTARSGLTGLVSAGGRGGLRGARERYSIAAIALRAVRVRVLICFFRASASAE